MSHPEHIKDYFKFCIRVTHQGNYAFVTVDQFGKSLQLDKACWKDVLKEDREGQSIGHKVGSMVEQGLRTIGRNKQNLRLVKCITAVFLPS